MKTMTIDGRECVFFVERASDGGAIINAVAPDTGGKYVNFRQWYSDPAQAAQDFDALDGHKASVRIKRAFDEGVSGKRHTE